MNSRNLTVPLMILAFVLMGGMLWWLSTTAPEEVQVVEGAETDAAGESTTAGATRVRMRDFDATRDQYLGQRIELAGVEVIGRINDRLVWLAPEDNSVLVVLDADMAGSSNAPSNGDSGTIVGEYRAMSDSVLDAWMESGVLESDNQRFSASFRSAYLEALSLDLRSEEDR